MSSETDAPPANVSALMAAYGAPSDTGFGSAVFHEPIGAADALADVAKKTYRCFVGETWDRFGADAWMGPWKEVYVRPRAANGDVVAELRGITDQMARQSVPMILEVVQNAEQARAALAEVYDDPAMTEMRVYNIGDGEAMSGLLVAGRNAAQSASTCLVFLMD